MQHLPAIAAPDGLADRIRGVLPDAVQAASVHAGELTLQVERTMLLAVLQQLRDLPDCQYAQLMDIAGVDYPDRPDRFEINYHLLSLRHNRRVRVRVTTDGIEPVPSAVSLWPVAGWLEREVWDMFGVLFEGNPDHRRILTDYGFEGHPFRKDFPLTGHVELHYSEEAGRVVYAPVKLKQDFRNFDFLSPWEGNWAVPEDGAPILPGDEKAGSA